MFNAYFFLVDVLLTMQGKFHLWEATIKKLGNQRPQYKNVMIGHKKNPEPLKGVRIFQTNSICTWFL